MKLTEKETDLIIEGLSCLISNDIGNHDLIQECLMIIDKLRDNIDETEKKEEL